MNVAGNRRMLIQHRKSSLNQTNEAVLIQVSWMEKARLGLVAEEQGVKVSELLRRAVNRVIEDSRAAHAEVMRF